MSNSNTNSKPDNETTNGDDNPPSAYTGTRAVGQTVVSTRHNPTSPPTTYPSHTSSTSSPPPQDPTILTTSTAPSISETESEPKEMSIMTLMDLKDERIAALERKDKWRAATIAEDRKNRYKEREQEKKDRIKLMQERNEYKERLIQAVEERNKLRERNKIISNENASIKMQKDAGNVEINQLNDIIKNMKKKEKDKAAEEEEKEKEPEQEPVPEQQRDNDANDAQINIRIVLNRF